MQLRPVDVLESITPPEFRIKYLLPQKPVVIKDLSRDWPAATKWNWDYFKELIGDKKVAIYNNQKSDRYTPVNKADRYASFGDYIDMIRKGPAGWRIFLFNIFLHAPGLTGDFTWPDHLLSGFIKRMPMLFAGGEGSITHMHFDIDMSHIFHTQFIGKKRVLLFPYSEQYRLYRKPFEVLSMADFSYYYDPLRSKLDYTKFPALQEAEGYEVTLAHGDTLFMPGGYWHHMEYLESGLAMSLRALQKSLYWKLKGAWNLAGMRHIDTLLKKTMAESWGGWKEKKVHQRAAKTGTQSKTLSAP